MLAKMFFDSPAAMGSVMLASQHWSNSARNWLHWKQSSFQYMRLPMTYVIMISRNSGLKMLCP